MSPRQKHSGLLCQEGLWLSHGLPSRVSFQSCTNQPRKPRHHDSCAGPLHDSQSCCHGQTICAGHRSGHRMAGEPICALARAVSHKTNLPVALGISRRGCPGISMELCEVSGVTRGLSPVDNRRLQAANIPRGLNLSTAVCSPCS